MGVAGDICRKITALGPAQIAVLDTICAVLDRKSVV